jgi:DNA-directed RNA polymerase
MKLNVDSLFNELCMSVQALDVLGETRWKINRQVMEVVEKLWENGGGIADLVESTDVSIQEFGL